jgi:putative transcriptional regulator
LSSWEQALPGRCWIKGQRQPAAARARPRGGALENWEQGRAKPNAQAALLIGLVRKYPDMVARLAEV